MSELESIDDPSNILNLDDEPELSTPLQLYQELLSCGEMILTIPAEEEERLRKGLASAKAKQNSKIKAEGLAVDNSVLEFNKIPSPDHEGAIQITITLTRKGGITVLKKEYPDQEF